MLPQEIRLPNAASPDVARAMRKYGSTNGEWYGVAEGIDGLEVNKVVERGETLEMLEVVAVVLVVFEKDVALVTTRKRGAIIINNISNLNTRVTLVRERSTAKHQGK
jgi:hypothetical protein